MASNCAGTARRGRSARRAICQRPRGPHRGRAADGRQELDRAFSLAYLALISLLRERGRAGRKTDYAGASEPDCASTRPAATPSSTLLLATAAWASASARRDADEARARPECRPGHSRRRRIRTQLPTTRLAVILRQRRDGTHALGLARTAGKRVGVKLRRRIAEVPGARHGCACLALNSRSA